MIPFDIKTPYLSIKIRQTIDNVPIRTQKSGDTVDQSETGEIGIRPTEMLEQISARYHHERDPPLESITSSV
jgi:hypothetical protein